MEENGTAAETVFSSSNESRNIDNDSEADFENDSNSNSKVLNLNIIISVLISIMHKTFSAAKFCDSYVEFLQMKNFQVK